MQQVLKKTFHLFKGVKAKLGQSLILLIATFLDIIIWTQFYHHSKGDVTAPASSSKLSELWRKQVRCPQTSKWFNTAPPPERKHTVLKLVKCNATEKKLVSRTFKITKHEPVGRNHVELRDMRHGTSLAGRVWGRSGNVKKKWRTGVDRDVIELFLLSALAEWCSVSEPVCLFKSRTKIDHDETALQGRGLVHFVGWPTSPLPRQWRSTRHACLRRWAAVWQGESKSIARAPFSVRK